MESMERTNYGKSCTEVQAEEYLKLVNIMDINRKESESELNQKSQELEDNLQNLYIKDPIKVHSECNFIYKSKYNDLPILSMKDTIVSTIATNSIVVIQGPTGCGKTTQIPQFILNAHIKKKINCNIIVTQPRRIAAISIAKRVSKEGGWPLGSLVGYKVGLRNEISSQTRLTYCTTHVLLNHLIDQKHMLNYTHIILDEIHERDKGMDFLLLIIKKLLQTNSGQVKVILMSATIDVKRFAEYFSTKVANKSVPAPILKIPKSRNFQIYTYYLNEIGNLGAIPEVHANEPKVTQAMINFCSRIIMALDQIDMNDNKVVLDSYERHSVLIFLPGIYEIEELYNYLSSVYHKNELWDLAILHSTISNDEQQRIFHKPPKGHRRIILSTNIAESSVTVPDIKYVIDFCLVKIKVVDLVTHYDSLQLQWASKVNCEQRAGRTGRVMDGRVYRLVPRKFYDNILSNESFPEMLRDSLANLILRAKILDLDEPRVLLSLSLDPPILSNLKNTILSLKEIGALVDEGDSFQPFDGKLTDLGRVMAYLPLDIRISKLIMLGHVFGVLRDAIILGASMAVKDIFSITQCFSTISSYTIRRKWARDSNSDCIAALNVYKTWQNEKANRRLTTYQAERQWAQRNSIELKALHELDALVKEITERLQNLKIKESIGINKVIWQGMDRDFVLQIILAGAFYPNYFLKCSQDLDIYKKNITSTLDTFDPTKTIYLKGWPRDQPGYLYAKEFQKIFSKHLGIPEKQIAVSFDKSNRVYVQFLEKKTMSTDESFYNISNFVYQAIKMRKCKIPIQIKLLNIKEANERARHHDLHKFTEQTLFFHKSFRIKSDIPKIRPELPSLDITFIPLNIQNIISPGYFWATIDDDDIHQKLEIINKSLKYSLKEFSSIPEETSTIIAAPMEKNNSLTYHRAIIEEHVPENKELVDIFFIDYGCSSRVRFSDLREIDDITILEIPCLAFRCNLAFLQPSNQSNFHGRWSKFSKNYFRMQVEKNKKIFGKIYSIVDSTINLELIVVNNKGEKFDVNESLIEKGYAVKREENYLSKYNHELRESINNVKMSVEETKYYEEKQYDKDYLFEYPSPPEEEDCDSSVKLFGPYSPLETQIVQLISVERSKKATIEKNSVNSVLLDNDPNQSGLLVAQSANHGVYNNLILRNTTFLPIIPGLATLLALIFTPRMELRCNNRKTYYSGALCGLGPINNTTGQAIFPDHDIEIKFDVEITIDDVREINKLRHWMNAGMQLDTNLNSEHIINCQNRLKCILLELRDRQRKSLNPLIDEVDYFTNKWNCYKLHLLPSTEETTRKSDVYPLHEALELCERNEDTEKMLKHLSELQRLAFENVYKMKMVVIFCKLCEMEMVGLLELRGHLCSKQHLENEKLLK